MKIIKRNWQEIPVATGWLVACFVLMGVLDNSTRILAVLQPLTSTVLSGEGLFTRWNRFAPFDAPAVKTLTAVFLLLVPVQIASVFMIADTSICPKAQAKGIGAFIAVMSVLALIQPLIFVWGLSINGPLRIFGKNSLWGAAATVFLATFAFSYVVRMLPVLLALCSSKRQVRTT